MSRSVLVFITIFWIAVALSLIRPHDYFTWFLEAAPALSAFAILVLTYKRFRFSNLVYTLILLHSIILLIGAHWTYAEVPLFNWLRDRYHLARNSYDGIGHFAQGFFPAIVAREILVRKSIVRRSGWWLPFVVVCIVFAFSAFYELIEWWVSLATGSAGDAFLGTQGDIWDTQKDMALCLTGSIVSLLVLSGLHDTSMKQLPPHE